jgi:TPR repeat protein
MKRHIKGENMNPYVFINCAAESKNDAMRLIELLEKAGIQAECGSASEEKMRNCSFVLHLSTPASRSSKTYRRNTNLCVRFDKDCIVMHMEDGILLTETETMLDTVLAAFKYACRNEAAAEEPAEPVEAVEAEEEAVEPAQTAEAEEEAEEPAESGQAAAEEADQQPVTEVPEQEESREMEQLALSERERLYQEGRKLLTGTDGDPDPEKAFEYFKQSANQGYTKAQYQLCVCYDEGIGVRRNVAEAARWCEMAAYGGYAKAQSEIGYCYEYGHGVLRNTREAVRWYRIAAEHGNIEAKNNLAYCYQKGRGVSKNVEEAIRLYTEASEAGHASAQYNLGFCYWYGEGVAIDKNKAVELFRESARRGNARADQMMRILNQHSYIHDGKEES